MRTIFVLFFVSFISLAYSQKAIKIDLEKAINGSEKTILLSDIASDIRYIPLETTEECLIGGNFNMTYTPNAIIAASTEETTFYHFDENGRFKNTIGKKGQGPGEFAIGLFYFLDPQNNLFYTHDWQVTHCYTYDGEFIKKIETPDLNMGVAEMLGDDMIVYSNDMFYHTKKGATPYQLYVVDSEGKLLHKFKANMKEGEKYGMNLTTRDYMYVHKGETFFKPALENVIYKISLKTKTPVWEFQTDKKGIDKTKDETDPRNRLKSISVFRVQETDKYLFVLYGLEKNTYLGMYDKSTQTFQNVSIQDDLSGGIDFIPSGKCSEGYLINVYPVKSFKEQKKINHWKIKRKNKRITDNSILR
jgi:hypothetical protein